MENHRIPFLPYNLFSEKASPLQDLFARLSFIAEEVSEADKSPYDAKRKPNSPSFSNKVETKNILNHGIRKNVEEKKGQYRRMKKVRGKSPSRKENEVRVTTWGTTKNYVTYAKVLFEVKKFDEIIIKGVGRAIYNTILVTEMIKKNIVGLHQIASIDTCETHDTWEPIGGPLNKTKRYVSMVRIVLSKKKLDTSSIGYQPPLSVEWENTWTKSDDESECETYLQGNVVVGRGKTMTTRNGFLPNDYGDGYGSRAMGGCGWEPRQGWERNNESSMYVGNVRDPGRGCFGGRGNKSVSGLRWGWNNGSKMYVEHGRAHGRGCNHMRGNGRGHGHQWGGNIGSKMYVEESTVPRGGRGHMRGNGRGRGWGRNKGNRINMPLQDDEWCNAKYHVSDHGLGGRVVRGRERGQWL